MLRCPVCKEELYEEPKKLVCKNGHSFDKARQGYVNLALRTKPGGDNKAMVQARSAFLEKGAYTFLREYLVGLVKSFHPSVLVDIGCGQGYYTQALADCAKETIGIDLSKEAILHAAKTDKKSRYIIASIFDLPLFDECADLAVSIFTPIPDKEIERILKPGGIFITVGPGPRHLWELKSVLYQTVYENPKTDAALKGFSLCSENLIADTSRITDLWDLFEMTPYRYKSPKEGMDELKKLDALDIRFEFMIRVYRKEDHE